MYKYQFKDICMFKKSLRTEFETKKGWRQKSYVNTSVQILLGFIQIPKDIFDTVQELSVLCLLFPYALTVCSFAEGAQKAKLVCASAISIHSPVYSHCWDFWIAATEVLAVLTSTSCAGAVTFIRLGLLRTGIIWHCCGLADTAWGWSLAQNQKYLKSSIFGLINTTQAVPSQCSKIFVVVLLQG